MGKILMTKKFFREKSITIALKKRKKKDSRT